MPMMGEGAPCPMGVQGTTVQATETADGMSMAFTTTGDVGELRRRAHAMADRMNGQASGAMGMSGMMMKGGDGGAGMMMGSGMGHPGLGCGRHRPSLDEDVHCRGPGARRRPGSGLRFRSRERMLPALV